MSWLRIVCDKAKQTIYYEHGNHARPSPIQMRKLKELAQDAEFKLVCDNTGREVDICETKKKLSKADKLLERPFQQAKLAWSLPRQAPPKKTEIPKPNDYVYGDGILRRARTDQAHTQYRKGTDMRTLIIPDIHHNTEAADYWLHDVEFDRVVFLGDYFDSYDDTPEDSESTARWLLRQVAMPNRVLLWGNHDVHYAFPDAHDLRSPGYTDEKSEAINSVFRKEHWWRFKVAHVEQGWLLSHAGLNATSAADKHLHGPLRSGSDAISRGPHRLDGPLLRDWERLEPVAGVNQIVGHTPGTDVRSRCTLSSRNHCLDVDHGRIAAVLEHGRLSTHVMPGTAFTQ